MDNPRAEGQSEEDHQKELTDLFTPQFVRILLEEFLSISLLKSLPDSITPLGQKFIPFKERLETQGLKKAFKSLEGALAEINEILKSFDSINAVMDEEKKKESDEKKVAAAVKKQQQEVDRASYAANSNGAEKTSAYQQGGKRTYSTGCYVCKDNQTPKHEPSNCKVILELANKKEFVKIANLLNPQSQGNASQKTKGFKRRASAAGINQKPGSNESSPSLRAARKTMGSLAKTLGEVRTFCTSGNLNFVI
ncbi:hypothetical protein BDR26DRAFT_960484 [Obelidium mucronatum]|nr:hypothetical protein BDR26DRAFT_960484 [Obelidium mucronatum]